MADDWKADITPEVITVEVCLDRTLVGELEALNAKREKRAGMLDDGAGKRLRELKKQIESKMRTFSFKSVGRQQWRKMLAEHPPKPEDRKLYGADHDPETFPPVAMAATCTEPGLTEDEARWLMFEAELPESVINRIWGACLKANVEGSDEKKALAIASPRIGEKK